MSYSDLGNGTVMDWCTGLMWQRDTAPGTYRWQQALEYCKGLSLGGHNDWRLPNARELQNIVDYGRWDPSIDPVFGAEPCYYWSSSDDAFGHVHAWGVHFNLGNVHLAHKYGDYYVRAVRGGS